MSVVNDAETELKLLKQYLVQCHLAPSKLETDKQVCEKDVLVSAKKMSFYYYRVYSEVDEEGAPLPGSPPSSDHMGWRMGDTDSLHLVFEHASCSVTVWTNREFEDYIAQTNRVSQNKRDYSSFEPSVQGKPSTVLARVNCAIVTFAHSVQSQ